MGRQRLSTIKEEGITIILVNGKSFRLKEGFKYIFDNNVKPSTFYKFDTERIYKHGQIENQDQATFEKIDSFAYSYQ